jgi:hypothetical protein
VNEFLEEGGRGTTQVGKVGGAVAVGKLVEEFVGGAKCKNLKEDQRRGRGRGKEWCCIEG